MAAETVAGQVTAAYRQFFGGQAQAARGGLEALLRSPDAESPTERLLVGGALLDICLHNRDDACVMRHAADFLAAVEQHARGLGPVQRRRLALEAAYYVDSARALAGVSPQAILAGAGWTHEIAYDGDLYLRRQVLASNLLLQSGRRADLDRSLDKILSLAASLENPRAASFTVAASLADVMATLLAVGETDRAFGLYRASGADIAAALPPQTLDAVLYAITRGQLQQAVGDTASARSSLKAAVAILQRIELEPAVRQQLLAQALTLEAVLDAASGDQAAARAALAQHPFAMLYEAAGRKPASADEVAYLAARAFVAALDQKPDAVVAQALQAPAAFAEDLQTSAYRAAGLALATPPGPARAARLTQLGRKIQAAALQADKAGELDRLDVIDQILVALALSQGDLARTPAGADVAFSLFQLAGRTGASFDADALTALGQARDELQRRTIHQALRLKARRDRLERAGVQRTTAALRGPAETGTLAHDIPRRALLRDYDERLAQAEAGLARDHLSLRGPRLVPLARLQAALGEDEAALAIAPAIGGAAYFCVRRDSATQHLAAVDLARLKIDAKVVQAALTSTEPPSEALDVQFPAEAAVRLYDVLLKPFESCLRPGDRIQWLGGVASAVVPLAALLPVAPPRLEGGYDLAKADWVARRHAISYAGSAGALVATRSRVAPPAAAFDFLGVGDPRLASPGTGGSRFAGLAALPETADELRASAKGFAATRLLLGEEATEARVRGEVLGDYRYLSFATHGLLRDDLQGLSDPALVLTPASQSGGRDDGLLTASEIADMNLGASFVALSACNTANFDFDEAAQDLPALASAFAVSGVPATLGTLWPVDSRTGQTVVAGLFDRLRAGRAAPADALAQAQRSFLAAPPARAHLHPRFWAPFVILGDGGPMNRGAPAAGPALLAAELLTPPGGEVLALADTPDGLAARFIAEPDAEGAAGEGLRLAIGSTESWRKVGHAARASRVLGQVGEVLIAGGYEMGAKGRLQPRLDAYDRWGRHMGAWRGEGLSQVDAGILTAITPDASSMLIVVGERPRPGEAGGETLRVLRVGPDLALQPVFEAAAPAGARISSAVLAPLGERLLLAYTADNHRSEQPAPSFEDYDDPLCAPRRETLLELRDARSGALLESGTISGFAAVAGVPHGSGAMLGGSQGEGCRAERKAAVLAIDAGLRATPLYLDAALGASEVRALAPLQGERTFVAAYKESLFDMAPAAGPRGADPASIAAGRSYSALVLTLDRDGRASAAKPLDAGADVLPTAALALEGGQVLLGGSLAGRAAIFRFAVPP